MNVAFYARVSTDYDNQTSSMEAQRNHFINLLTDNPTWCSVGIFSDEGITGRNMKYRDGLNALIELCMSHSKVDLVITKSISRLARNTVDLLTIIRKLKSVGTAIYFEKENINTLSISGELLVTILSSLAQEESASLSRSISWGIKESHARGKVILPGRKVYGYKLDDLGRLNPVPEEAEVISYIFKMQDAGFDYRDIARELTSEEIPAPRGGDKWASSTVKYILSNEKYYGNMLVPKTYTPDFFSGISESADNKVDQRIIYGHHESII